MQQESLARWSFLLLASATFVFAASMFTIVVLFGQGSACFGGVVGNAAFASCVPHFIEMIALVSWIGGTATAALLVGAVTMRFWRRRTRRNRSAPVGTA